MAASNLLHLGSGKKTFTCTFDLASGGCQGAIEVVYDQLFGNDKTADQIWASCRSVQGDDSSIVYVGLAIKGSTSAIYIGKAAGNLSRRYSAAGPSSGGLRSVFDLFINRGDSMAITIYSTAYPCFVEGWCFQVAASLHYSLQNIIDPN